MARSNGHDWLDEAISKTAPGQSPQPDFQTWQKMHADALDTLRHRAQRTSQRGCGPAAVVELAGRMMRSPMARLAVAAVLVVAALLLAMYAMNRPSDQSEPRPYEAVGTPRTTQAMLARATQLCDQGDTEGLLLLLKTDRVETRALLVEHLGQSGDLTALSALERLATESRGAGDVNTVRYAIDQIRQRQALAMQSASYAVDSNADQTASVPRVVTVAHTTVGQPDTSIQSVQGDSVASEGEVSVSVQVVDKATGGPLADVLVYAESGYRERSVAVARTDAMGKCTLNMPREKYHVVAEGWENGRFESAKVPLTVRSGEARVRIHTTVRSKVMGRLIDLGGAPVQGTVQLDGGLPTETDTAGWFAIDEPFGDASKYHVLWAYDPKRQIGAMLKFRMADYTDALVVALAPCAAIVGRAVDSQGSALDDMTGQLAVDTPDGTVFCYNRVPWTLDVDSDGNFFFTNVPAGLPLRVNVERKHSLGGIQGGGQIAQLVPGEPVDIGDLVVRAIDLADESIDWTGTLTGTIIDEYGAPVAGATVLAGLPEDRKAYADPEGRYALTGLPKGARLSFRVDLPGRRAYCWGKYVYANSQSGDVQLLLHGHELLGRKAPPLSVSKWMTGDPVALDQLQGRVVLLVMGVVGQLQACNEFDLLRSMSERYAERGLEVIVVLYSDSDLSSTSVPEPLLRDMLPEQMASIVSGWDDANKTWMAYRIDVAPMTYLIDKRGYIRASTSEKSLRLRQWIEALLTE